MKTELVTTLKRQATRILADLHSSREPVLITGHDQTSAYFVDVADHEQMSARMAILEGIARGEQAIQSGQISTDEAARRQLAKWLQTLHK